MSGSIVCTIEARMTSTRLPGKVLEPAAGRPLLAHMIERLQRCPTLDEIVVATTTNPDDDPIDALAGELGVGASAAARRTCSGGCWAPPPRATQT